MKSSRIGDGHVIGNKIVFDAYDDEYKSDRFEGYRLPDYTMNQIVDAGIDFIVFLDPNRGRYTISVDDWLDYAVDSEYDQWTHCRQSWMDRG